MAYREYAHKSLNSTYYLYGDLEIALLNIEVQDVIPLVGLYCNRIYLSGGYRGVYLDGSYYHSTYLRANMVVEKMATLVAECGYAINDGSFFWNVNLELKLF